MITFSENISVTIFKSRGKYDSRERCRAPSTLVLPTRSKYYDLEIFTRWPCLLIGCKQPFFTTQKKRHKRLFNTKFLQKTCRYRNLNKYSHFCQPCIISWFKQGNRFLKETFEEFLLSLPSFVEKCTKYIFLHLLRFLHFLHSYI